MSQYGFFVGVAWLVFGLFTGYIIGMKQERRRFERYIDSLKWKKVQK